MNLKKNNIKTIVTEIIFDNVYDKYFSFSDIEKYIITNNFRMVAINLVNNNLFSGLVFSSDVCYFNKKYFDLWFCDIFLKKKFFLRKKQVISKLKI